MNLQQYEDFVRSAWNDTNDTDYTVIALAGEAGEVANAYKKHFLRAPGARGFDEDNNVPDELGDVLYYLVRLGQEMDCSLEEIMRMNMRKLLDRGMVPDHERARFEEMLQDDSPADA